MDFYLSGNLAVVEIGEPVSVIYFDGDWEVELGRGGCNYGRERAITQKTSELEVLEGPVAVCGAEGGRTVCGICLEYCSA